MVRVLCMVSRWISQRHELINVSDKQLTASKCKCIVYLRQRWYYTSVAPWNSFLADEVQTERPRKNADCELCNERKKHEVQWKKQHAKKINTWPSRYGSQFLFNLIISKRLMKLISSAEARDAKWPDKMERRVKLRAIWKVAAVK